jgi:hypothetical protein
LGFFADLVLLALKKMQIKYAEVTAKRQNPISVVKIQQSMSLYPSNMNQENQEIVRLNVTSTIEHVSMLIDSLHPNEQKELSNSIDR